MEESFNERVRFFHGQVFTVFSVLRVNLRSVKANLSHFEHYLQLLNLKFPVIGTTEIWLNNNTCDLFSLPNVFIHWAPWAVWKWWRRWTFYKGWYKVSGKVRFGNVHRSKHVSHYLFKLIKLNSTVVKHYNRGNLSSSQYRYATFLGHYKNPREIFKHEDEICYLIGDYNINLLNVDYHNLTGEFSDLVYSSGLFHW